jgi:hypothetical protein
VCAQGKRVTARKIMLAQATPIKKKKTIILIYRTLT